MLRFTFHDTSKVVVREMCSKHSRYNPAVDGDGGIVGGCSTCQQILAVWIARQKAESAIRDFRVIAEPWMPTKLATSPSVRRQSRTSASPLARRQPLFATSLGRLGVAVKTASKHLMVFAGCQLAIPFAAGAQSTCPIEVVTVNPRAVSVINGTTLLASYRNTTSMTITHTGFDARSGSRLRPVALSIRHPVGSGRTDATKWGESAWLSTAPSSGHVTIWPQTVIYADGSVSADNETNGRAFHSKTAVRVALGINGRCAISLAGRSRPQTEQDELRPNVQAGARLAAAGSGAEQKMALVRTVRSSLCIAHTYPRGASISGDGKTVSAEPIPSCCS